MKKMFSIVLAAILVLVSIPFSASAAGYPSGTCGENVKWKLNDDTGVLTITGEGEIVSESSSYASYPWSRYESDIKSIVIGDGITKIGEKAFYDLHYLKTVTIGNGVTVIAESAFEDCIYLNTVTVGSGVKTVERGAFYKCTQLKDLYYAGDISGWCGIDFDEWKSANPQYYAKNFYVNGTLLTGDLAIPD